MRRYIDLIEEQPVLEQPGVEQPAVEPPVTIGPPDSDFDDDDEYELV